jgi:hypothetical protein
MEWLAAIVWAGIKDKAVRVELCNGYRLIFYDVVVFEKTSV